MNEILRFAFNRANDAAQKGEFTVTCYFEGLEEKELVDEVLRALGEEEFTARIHKDVYCENEEKAGKQMLALELKW